MKNGNYKVKRDDILVGKIIKLPFEERILDVRFIPTNELYPNSQEYIDAVSRSFEPRPWFIEGKPACWPKEYDERIRNVLFILNEAKLFDDLLYDTPNYPVLGISELEDCEKSIMVIDDAFKIGRVLKYLGYNEILTLKDIENIKNNLFQDWILTHTEIFGIYYTGPHGSGTECRDKNGVHYTFNDERDDGPIPASYFEAWWCNACKGNEDNFIPKTKEKVKKLI